MAVALVVSHPIKNKVGAVDHWDRTTVAVFATPEDLRFLLATITLEESEDIFDTCEKYHAYAVKYRKPFYQCWLGRFGYMASHPEKQVTADFYWFPNYALEI